MKVDDADMAKAIQAQPEILLQGDAMDPPAVDRKLLPLSRWVPEAFDLFEARSKSEAFVPWPADWSNLERLVPHGLLPGLHILVGATGSGKTQWALQLAVAAACRESGREPVPVLFVALEADADFADLVARVSDMAGHGHSVGGWSGIYRGEAARNGVLPAVRAKAEPFIQSLSLVPERGPLNVEALGTLCRRFADGHKRTNGQPALVVVDYLQRVDVGSEDRRAAMGKLSGTLRKVATEEGLAILALSSTARENYGTLLVELQREGGQLKECKLDGLRQWMPGTYSPERLVGLGKEAGELEYDADTVLTIVKGKVSGEEDVHWLAVSKQRAGRADWAPMRFEWTMRGMTWANREPEASAAKPRRQAKSPTAGNGGAQSIDLSKP
jgi:replicative DNA helicase